MVSTSQENASGALHLIDHLIELVRRGAKPEMRYTAIADGFAGLGPAERDEIARARRADEHHVVALAETNLQPERVEVEFFRSRKIGHVQIDVVQSQ